jgi:activator of HSP90 ATPase
LALGGIAVHRSVNGQTKPPPGQDAAGNPANQSRTSLHQDVEFDVAPARICEALLDAKQFAEFTSLPAKIDPRVGGAFSMFGGLIVGVNVDLVPHQRIVQAWRPTHWDEGVYSIVRFELAPRSSGTKLALDHTGFPEGEFDHLNTGWPLRYWAPLKKYLAPR